MPTAIPPFAFGNDRPQGVTRCPRMAWVLICRKPAAAGLVYPESGWQRAQPEKRSTPSAMAPVEAFLAWVHAEAAASASAAPPAARA
ncbi:MAG: hypothetical protein U1E89_19625 [Burkholderiaceae bacterium]